MRRISLEKLREKPGSEIKDCGSNGTIKVIDNFGEVDKKHFILLVMSALEASKTSIDKH